MNPRKNFLNICRKIKKGDTSAGVLAEFCKTAVATQYPIFEDAARIIAHEYGGGVAELSSGDLAGLPIDRMGTIDVLKSEARRRDADTVTLETIGEMLRLLDVHSDSAVRDQLGFSSSNILLRHANSLAGSKSDSTWLRKKFYGPVSRFSRRLKRLHRQQPELAKLMEQYSPPPGAIRQKLVDWQEEFRSARLSAVLGTIAVLLAIVALSLASRPTQKPAIAETPSAASKPTEPSVMDVVSQSIDDLKKLISGPNSTVLIFPDGTDQSSRLTELLAGTENARVIGNQLIAEQLSLDALPGSVNWVEPDLDFLAFARPVAPTTTNDEAKSASERFLIAVFENKKDGTSVLRVLDANDGYSSVFQKSGRSCFDAHSTPFHTEDVSRTLRLSKQEWAQKPLVTGRLVRIIDSTIQTNQLPADAQYVLALTLYQVSEALGKTSEDRIKELIRLADLYPSLPSPQEHQLIGKLRSSLSNVAEPVNVAAAGQTP